MKTALLIGAHPDDVEIGCGGTALMLKRQGYRLAAALFTSGEQGGDPSLREGEAREGARRLGIDELVFLRFPDGFTHPTPEMRIALIKLLRQHRPDWLFTHSPQDHFPDHRVLGQLTMDAVGGAAGPWYPEAGLAPHRVGEVFGYEVWHPLNRAQVFVDITTVLPGKLRALSAHASQITQVDYLGAVEGLARYRGTTSFLGKYAEAFESLRASLVSFT